MSLQDVLARDVGNRFPLEPGQDLLPVVSEVNRQCKWFPVPPVAPDDLTRHGLEGKGVAGARVIRIPVFLAASRALARQRALSGVIAPASPMACQMRFPSDWLLLPGGRLRTPKPASPGSRTSWFRLHDLRAWFSLYLLLYRGHESGLFRVSCVEWREKKQRYFNWLFRSAPKMRVVANSAHAPGLRSRMIRRDGLTWLRVFPSHAGRNRQVVTHASASCAQQRAHGG